MVACRKLASDSGCVISASPVALPWLNCPVQMPLGCLPEFVSSGCPKRQLPVCHLILALPSMMANPWTIHVAGTGMHLAVAGTAAHGVAAVLWRGFLTVSLAASTALRLEWWYRKSLWSSQLPSFPWLSHAAALSKMTCWWWPTLTDFKILSINLQLGIGLPNTPFDPIFPLVHLR